MRSNAADGSRDELRPPPRILGGSALAATALGTALGVTEDTDPYELDEDHPARQGLEVYGWLGWVQESLLSCVEPRLP